MKRARHHIHLTRLGAVVLAVPLLLSACAAKDVMAPNSSGYVTDVEQRVSGVDWNRAATIDVVLTEYKFTPSSLRFQEGQPYRLHLINRGSETHDFSSKPFFQAIAAAKLVSKDNTASLPRLASIGVSPGDTKDLYFVPVRRGSYPIECEELLHSTFGMTGVARIE